MQSFICFWTITISILVIFSSTCYAPSTENRGGRITSAALQGLYEPTGRVSDSKNDLSAATLYAQPKEAGSRIDVSLSGSTIVNPPTTRATTREPSGPNTSAALRGFYEQPNQKKKYAIR